MAITHREIVHEREPADTAESPAYGAAAIILWIVGVIEVLLAIRLLFSLFGANQANGLVAFIYSVTAPIVAPFAGIFQANMQVGAARLEWETILAMVAVAIIGWLIGKLLAVFRA